MSSAGYGNHQDSRPGDASNKPAAGEDRPGADLGGAADKAGTGQQAGTRSSPDPTGTGPHSGLKDSTSPTLTDDDRRDVATPGDGAGPTGPQGGEVDPGAG